MENYQVLGWTPQKSMVCKVYATDVSLRPKIIGISNSWGQEELILKVRLCEPEKDRN
jgi:hypothetical protein